MVAENETETFSEIVRFVDTKWSRRSDGIRRKRDEDSYEFEYAHTHTHTKRIGRRKKGSDGHLDALSGAFVAVDINM